VTSRLEKKRNRYRLPIGDWSADGHGRCEWFTVSVHGTKADISMAYGRAQKKLPDLDPAGICSDYEDHAVDPEIFESLVALGAISPGKDEDPSWWMHPERMAALVVWYLNQGDPGLEARLEPKDDSLAYTFGSSFGYGLFS
jgi:hypothetical protein